jgi:hypothetical protein
MLATDSHASPRCKRRLLNSSRRSFSTPPRAQRSGSRSNGGSFPYKDAEAKSGLSQKDGDLRQATKSLIAADKIHATGKPRGRNANAHVLHLGPSTNGVAADPEPEPEPMPKRRPKINTKARALRPMNVPENL